MKPTPEVLRAIETAIEIEEEGLAYYTKAAEQVDDPKGKRMFQTLARDEAAHLELFKNARRTLTERESWLSATEACSYRTTWQTF